jgi:hypothetical protein
VAREPLSHVRFGMLSVGEVPAHVVSAKVLSQDDLIQIFEFLGSARTKGLWFNTRPRQRASPPVRNPAGFGSHFGAGPHAGPGGFGVGGLAANAFGGGFAGAGGDGSGDDEKDGERPRKGKRRGSPVRDGRHN